MSSEQKAATVVLCPGQGAQAVNMGRAWAEASAAARAVFEEADALLAADLGSSLTSIMFDGPTDRLNQTNVSQPAIYACSVACFRGMAEVDGELPVVATAGLSLGEYTALHLAGAFDFATGLRLVARRGALMQAAAEASQGSMVALIGATDEQADAVCDEARGDDVLIPANYNAPGQIVISGSAAACDRAVEVAAAHELRATALAVAGAFHSPLMDPAAAAMGEVLAEADISAPERPVWSNVTGAAHVADDLELLRRRLVEQIVQPVRWAQGCQDLIEKAPALAGDPDTLSWHELAPGSTLRGLMRRIDRSTKVTSHDQP